MNRPKAIIEANDELEQYEMYSEEPLCDHDGDGARQHIATIYDHEEAHEILRLWNSLENENTVGTDTRSSLSSCSPCECRDWCREGQRFVTTHHPRCSKYSPEDDAYKIIVGLLRGIEAWAQDEDGVHPECWEAYKAAKAAVWEAHLVRHESDE